MRSQSPSLWVAMCRAVAWKYARWELQPMRLVLASKPRGREPLHAPRLLLFAAARLARLDGTARRPCLTECGLSKTDWLAAIVMNDTTRTCFRCVIVLG